MRTLTILAAFLALAVMAGLSISGDGMAACQSTHSYDVCNDQLH